MDVHASQSFSSVYRDHKVGLGASEYREFRPSCRVAEYLICLWTQTIHSPTEFPHQVLPDCCIDIVLLNDAPVVVGPWTEAFVAHLQPGTRLIGARFYPGIMPTLFGIPASELLNRSLPLVEVLGSAATVEFAPIVDQAGPAARMSAMQEVILGRVAKASSMDSLTRAAIQWIARHPHGRVEQLSHWLGLSRRQIQRRFTTAVGYGPKLFQSVLRFQRLLDLAADTGVQGNLAQFAAEAEYADQAHMSREVQRFSGTPPSKLLRSSRCTLELSNLIQPPGSISY